MLNTSKKIVVCGTLRPEGMDASLLCIYATPNDNRLEGKTYMEAWIPCNISEK